jgi:hypothetical protein
MRMIANAMAEQQEAVEMERLSQNWSGQMLDINMLKKTMAAATPGPWRQEDGTTLVWGACNPDDMTTCGMGYPVATARTKLGFDDQWREDTGMANAALIALAPTLAAELIEARAERDALREALEYADGCFEAALAEGWIDALSNGDHAAILSLWHRRLSYARDKFPAALGEPR